VVALVTGHGLKTVEALTGSAGGRGPTATIAPTMAAFDAAFDAATETEETTR
jgi:hypothetical protein